MSKIEAKVFYDHGLSKPRNPRYVVKDMHENVLDDAQGYGYKSRIRAIQCFTYKCKKNGIDVKFV